MSIGRMGKMLAICAALAATMSPFVGSARAESKARIVRLSEVQGKVQIDRGAGEGLEKAFLNLPVIEGSRLKTGDDGRAEVEFEDGSALRIVPNSEVEFTRLALGDDGQKLNTMQLDSGTAYVNVRAKKGDQYMLNFGHESVTVTEAAHFRIDLAKAEANLAVFKGKVSVAGPSGQFEVAEKRSATFDLANNDSYALAKNLEEDPYDAWDRQQSEYHDRYASNRTYDMSSPYAYGVSDLNYYGSYFNAPGYGYVWQPYLIGAGWSPFQDGGWAWYPGYGYMWVSGYPWGWMPYRYGSWMFAPGFGWVWQPGYWNTWYPIPQVVNPPKRTLVPTPPVRGHGIVMVGRGLAANPAGPPSRLTINPGSAGVGVPRGTVRHLDRLTKEMDRTSRPVVVSAQPPAPVSGVSPSAPAGGSRSTFPTRTAPPMRMPSPPPARSSTPHR